MKRKWIVILISIMLVSMSGCVETIEFDDEQEAKFIGYSVYAILEHDNNYMIGLNKVSIEENTETPSEDVDNPQTPDNGNSSGGSDGGNNNEDSSSQMVSMNTALGVEGVAVTYTDLVVCDEYPKPDGTPTFRIKALDGNNLVILKFDVTNTTGSDIRLDMLSKKLSYKGIFNDTVKTHALVTLLPEAMNTYKETIKSGETVETLLVYEMKKASAGNLNSIVLEIRSESGTNLVRIK